MQGESEKKQRIQCGWNNVREGEKKRRWSQREKGLHRIDKLYIGFHRLLWVLKIP